MQQVAIPSTEVLGGSVPGTPQQRGNRATRVPAILEVAISVFALHGNGGFTQRRIASEAGIRLRTLQHYFSTREDLLRASIETMVRRHLDVFRHLAKDISRSPESRLDAMVDETILTLTAPNSATAAFILHVWSLAEQEDFARIVIRDSVGDFQDLLAGLVAKINPLLTSAECTLRGALLLSNMLGLVVYVRRSEANMPDTESFRHATKVVCRTLSKAPQ